MAFNDLAEYFDDQLHLPINGVVYDIPSPDHELGLWVTELLSAGVSIRQGIALDPDRKAPKLRFEGSEYDDDSDEAKLYQRLLGSTYGKLRADGVSWPMIKFVAEVTMVWIAAGEAAAEAHWNAGGDPKALAAVLAPEQAPANRETRRHGTESTRTATESTTGTRASMRATTSRSPRKRA